MEALFLLFVAFTRSTTFAIIALILAVGFSGFAISGKQARESSMRLRQHLDSFIAKQLGELLHVELGKADDQTLRKGPFLLHLQNDC